MYHPTDEQFGNYKHKVSTPFIHAQIFIRGKAKDYLDLKDERDQAPSP
jgi:hypothetical protein